jgi:hypothetical protein
MYGLPWHQDLTDRLVREVVLHHLEPQAAVGVEGQVLHLERQAVDEVEEGLRVRGGVFLTSIPILKRMGL